MDRLWAPWRMEYVSRPTTGTSESGDFFLDLLAVSDEEGYIVHRGETSFVLLNAYPYNSGHVLVTPYRQVADLEALTLEEAAESHRLLARTIEVLKAEYRPSGFNVGLNLGSEIGRAHV